MTDTRPMPVAYLRRETNPWVGTLDDTLVLHYLLEAAAEGEEVIQGWIAAGQTKPDAVFAQIYPDPRISHRKRVTFAQSVFAVVLHGDLARASDCLFAMVDDFGRANRESVVIPNLRLGDGNSIWGGSVFYDDAPSLGGGLTVVQNHELTSCTLAIVMKDVHEACERRAAERNHDDGQQRRRNRDDTPGEERLPPLDAVNWSQASLVG